MKTINSSCKCSSSGDDCGSINIESERSGVCGDYDRGGVWRWCGDHGDGGGSGRSNGGDDSCSSSMLKQRDSKIRILIYMSRKLIQKEKIKTIYFLLLLT